MEAQQSQRETTIISNEGKQPVFKTWIFGLVS